MKRAAYDLRRRVLLSAGVGLLFNSTLLKHAYATGEVNITLSGSSSGSHVWYRPRGVLIHIGQTVRWTNTDTGNVHTVTAYHPDNGKPLRIPGGASSWDSGYLMPGESFLRVFDLPGVYDYFCIPHEQAGMVGRIIVGHVDPYENPYASTDSMLPEQAVAHFPDVADINKQMMVE